MNTNLSPSFARTAGIFLSSLALLCSPLAAQGKPAPGTPVPPAQAGELALTIFYNNDFHGYEPGNLARQAWLVKQARAQGLNVLFLNAGDVFTRGQWHSTFFGELEFSQLNAMGLDAFTLGNNEFKATERDDTSQARLLELIKLANFPVLCANVRYKADSRLLPGCAEYTIKTIQGVRIGILGVTANRVATYGQAYGLKVDDQLQTAKAVFARMDPETDLELALTHIGFDQDLLLAASLPGLELIVGGDSHTLLPQPVPIKGIPIVQAGGEANQYLGRLDCTFVRENGAWKLARYQGSLIPLDETVPQDPVCRQILDSFLDGLE